MGSEYIITSDGSFVSDDQLIHALARGNKGWVKPNHKYIDRKWRNGRYVYTYVTDTGTRAVARTASQQAVKENAEQDKFVERLNSDKSALYPSSYYILTSDGSFISDESLYHYGIKGMRWGIRRYQNPDGSLTAAGKKRLSKKSGDYMAPGKASNETIRRHVVFNEYRHNYDNTLQNAEDFLNKYSKATLLDLGLEASDSSVKYVSDMFANKSELIKRLRDQEARGIKLLNEKSSEISEFSKADQKSISNIVKRFSTDGYGRYVSNFKTDVGGDSKADVVVYSEKGQEVFSASEATKFLKKYNIEKAKEGIAKEYYDDEYSWIGKTPDSDNYYSREEFKSLITPETIIVDPKNKTYEVWWDDGGTYGYHAFTDEGSIEDMKVRYRSLNG